MTDQHKITLLIIIGCFLALLVGILSSLIPYHLPMTSHAVSPQMIGNSGPFWVEGQW